MIEKAIPIVETADIVIIIGTSLGVYPAAGLVNYVTPLSEKIYIDPKGLTENDTNFKVIKEKAGVGVPTLVNKLL
jgi:NAD-dependent deacetylase